MSQPPTGPPPRSPLVQKLVGPLAGLQSGHDPFPSRRTTLLSLCLFLACLVIGALAAYCPSSWMLTLVQSAMFSSAGLLLLCVAYDSWRWIRRNRQPQTNGQPQYEYRRNLANTVLLVIISLVMLPVLYSKFWKPALLQDVIQTNMDRVSEVYFPSLAVLQRADWTSQASLTLSNPPKCGLHWLPPSNRTLPACRDVPNPGTEYCDCASNWDTSITESLVWQNTTYRALTLHATADMLCVLPTTKMVAQVYFTYDATRAKADANRLLDPSLYLAVFDPTLTLTEALKMGYTRLRLVDANGVISATLGLVMRQAGANAAPAYDYDVGLSSDPAKDVPDGEGVGWLTVFVEFPGFERRVDVVRRAMEWSDVVATAGAWFSLFQIVSWILSGAALQV